MLLYGGTEGLVAAVPWEFPADTRNRRPHVPLVGLVRDGPYLRLLCPDEVRGVQLFYPGGFNWRGSEGSSVPRSAPIVPDIEHQLYVVRAGYGLPPPPRLLPLSRAAQRLPEDGGLGEAAAAEGTGGAATGGGSSGRGGRGGGGGGGRNVPRRGRPSTGGTGNPGPYSGYSDGVPGGADGATVWVLMGWRCGVLRFMRLSGE
ncbi:hypothetical protein Vafri_6658 [Volvox africanus]|nr:hypothetical protein Vafri_6658 [Volvox africanus]